MDITYDHDDHLTTTIWNQNNLKEHHKSEVRYSLPVLIVVTVIYVRLIRPLCELLFNLYELNFWMIELADSHQTWVRVRKEPRLIMSCWKVLRPFVLR